MVLAMVSAKVSVYNMHTEKVLAVESELVLALRQVAKLVLG